jgi:hypothetical protein
VQGEAEGDGSTNAFGVRGIASGSSNVFGLQGEAEGETSGVAQGMVGKAVVNDGATSHYGIKGTARYGTTSYGVWGLAQNATNNYAGYFSGDLAYTGDLLDVSDTSAKQNIRGLSEEDILSKITQLTPRRFEYKRTGDYSQMVFPEGDQFGLIAQEVEEIFPELVGTIVHPLFEANEEGIEQQVDTVQLKAVNYIELIPLLIQALSEQQARIAALEAAVGG